MFESERMERLVGTGQPPAEAKVQVDRRRLEAMITGERGGESAEAFFVRIERSTGATVSWPSRLKIRAKTKKDPFVKLAGTGPSVRRAAEMIGAQLGVKRERATLKMEISHCLHSQIIGRGGRNTQKIMRDTDCHIHFPDSNKLMPAMPALAQAKNDQVSISGCAKDVERARELLRAIGPLAVSVSIQLSLSRSLCAIQPRLDPVILQQKFPLQTPSGNGGNGAGGDVSVQFSQGSSQQQQQQHRLGSLHFVMRSNSRNELDMLRVFGQICQLIGVFPSGAELHCCSQFELRPTALPSLSAVRWICFRTNTQIQLNAQGLLIAGPLEGIFVARKFITGLLPVSLHFEKPARLPCLSGAAIRALERDLDVQIGEKRRRKTGKEREEDREFTVCTYEANLFNAYLARNRLLQLGDEHPAASSVSSGSSSSGCVDSSFPQDNDQAALMRSLCRESLLADQLPLPSQLPFPAASTSPPPPFPGERSAAQELAASWKAGKIGVILGGDGAAIEGPKSPDPEESPIAAGLLAGAKSVNLQKGEFRKALDRERMQLKATQAIYNSPPLLELSSGDRQAQQQRPPTDFWSGYGFSSSLPAELLRMGRLGGLWPADREFGQQNGAAAKPRGRPIMGRGNDSGDSENNGEAEKLSLPPIPASNSLPLSEPVKLAATELAASMAAGNEPKKATALVHPRVAALQAGEQKKPKFTMSTGGLFEGTLLPAPFSISEARPPQTAVGRSEPLASAAAAGPSTGTGQVQQHQQPAAQQWDIRSLTEPALVLAQLGLAEHVAFFREQEIDMQAFLLLDESCLSSLGVITLGARRKIMHAVMKLRESARRHGLYSL